MAHQEFVHLPLDAALEVASLLDQLTVSLDRIGSRAAGGMDESRMLRNFVDDADIARRASHLRMALWDACGAVLGEQRIDEVSEAIPVFPQVGGRDYH